MWRAIEQAISSTLGEDFKVLDSHSVAGGCINEAFRLQGEKQGFFVKLNRIDSLAMFEAEAAALRAIRATGTLRAPEPIVTGADTQHSFLVLEHIAFAGPPAAADARLGELLATMHRNSSGAFGWEHDNTIGSTPQLNGWTQDWLTFLRQYRFGPQLAWARDAGLPTETTHRAGQLLEAIPALFTGYHPQPSLLHGDLWSGNRATDSSGSPVIFDPAVYYGDREADIAMTELFGGFSADFSQAYNATWPLDPGYETRKKLYNLYHVLNHFNLFGGGYAAQAQTLIDRLLAELG
jgi:protein-ribulosamine 3-kinase